MAEICRMCLESRDDLYINVLDFVDVIENLVGIEFDRNPELPQMICDGCGDKLCTVKATCKLCANSYEFFLNYTPKYEPEELIVDPEDAEYVDFEILDEAIDETTLPEIKVELLDDFTMKPEPESEGTDQIITVIPKIENIKEHSIKKTLIGNVIFCETPKKVVAEVETVPIKRRKKNNALPNFYCCKCTEVVFSCEAADQHFTENHPECERNQDENESSDHQCKFCLNYFNTPMELKNHRVKKSQVSEFQFTCSLCDKSGLSLHDYKLHGESKHGSEATYTCPLCPLWYKNFSSFTSHVYIKHKNEQHNVCAECGKSYARKSYLDSHYRVEHEGRRDFKCKVCGVLFKRLCNLKSHMRVHTGEKPFKCADCPKEYSHYIDLKTHIAYRHTGIFQYNCSVCGKGFVKPSQLKLHMKKHAEAIVNKSDTE